MTDVSIPTGEAFCGACSTLVARFNLTTRQWAAVPSPGHDWPRIDHTMCNPKRSRR